MTLESITAAWVDRLQPESHLRLRVARGQPVWQATAHHVSDVIACIEQAHVQSQEGRFVVGYVAYEAAPAFDPALPVRAVEQDTPLAKWLAFEPDQVQWWDAGDPLIDAQYAPWLDACGANWFDTTFEQVKTLIEQGEFYQINLTTRLKSALPEGLHAWDLFLRLFALQAAEHSVLMNTLDQQIVSLSPELFFKWDGCELITSPMKGTRKPGQTNALALQDNPKDRAENVMIVDLLRNDMARVCQPRSVQVKSLFDVMHLPTVEQMTSTIEGKTRDNATLVDVFKALFPCGSVTGAPKRQAMQHIAQMEGEPRGVYCGAVGVMQPGGAVKMNVPIRTVTVQKNQMIYGVGSGLTWYSEAQAERKEWWQKTQFLRDATCDFHVLETLRLENGQWLRMQLHLKRMQAAAHYFGFVWDEVEVLQRVQTAAREHSEGIWRGRWLLNAQGELQVHVDAMPGQPKMIEIRLANTYLSPDDDWVRFKTTNRAHYDALAPSQPEVFDTLLFDPNGNLTETCRFNVVFEIENQRLTPRMSTCGAANLLGGVLRDQLLSENDVVEADLTVSDLARVQRAWLINSLRGWVEIDRITNCEETLLYSVEK